MSKKIAQQRIAEAKKNKSKRLDLSNLGLTSIPTGLHELEHLDSLSLRHNKINILETNKKLIHYLGWIKKQDSIFPENLMYLDLSHNNITDIKQLENYKNLTRLSLSLNSITDINSIATIINLTSLSLIGNQISDIKSIKNLTNLESLRISNNQIPDISPIKNLTNLKSLWINHNQISDIKSIKNLAKIKSLTVNHNQISDISSLKNLTNLESLRINHNQISDISSLKNLTNLTTLNLRDNKIQDISPILPLIKKGLKVSMEDRFKSNTINLFNNPISNPPLEIIQQGNEAILSYFEDLEKQGSEYLYEAKLLILGEGGAGKTSLARKLQNRQSEMPKEEETTRGIDIQPLYFPCVDGQEFKINLWDFGGQEIYHATHQFFLTKRSLYILVDDTRKDDKSLNDASFNYWLQTVELFGGGSPLLLVQNEKGDRSKALDLKSMQGQFDFIKEKYATNLLSNRGLDELQKDIEHYIQKLPHIGQKLPKFWIKVREDLLEQAKTKPYISLEGYYQICHKQQITEKQKALELSQYLHDLGTCLHFQKDDLLRKTIILQNEWVTNAVYRVLDDENIKGQYGHFSKEDVQNIWTESSYQDMIPELLQLMIKFELCYQKDGRSDEYLIPQLLSESEPDDFSWDREQNIQLRYRYIFMPKGLLSRLVVRTHHLLKDLDKAWKKGVVLERNKTFALVTETYARNEISIRISGIYQKELMTIISEEMDKLHRTYEGIKVQKFIPCNCDSCERQYEPHFYKFSSITKRIEKRKDTIECDNSYEAVSVFALIDNLFDQALKQRILHESRPDKEQHRITIIGDHNTYLNDATDNRLDID